MKKFLLIVLTLIMVLSLAACAGNQNANDNNAAEDNTNNNAAEQQKQQVQEDEELGDLTKVRLISEDWKESGHQYAIVDVAERGKPCSNCHDGNGFNAQNKEEFKAEHVTGIDCQACHSDVGAELIKNGEVELPFLDEPYEAGRGAVCMACHNGRRNPSELFEDSKANQLEKFTYPHYSMAAALLTGKGGMEIPREEYSTSSGHPGLDNTCASCHMIEAEEGYEQHTFVMEEEAIEQVCSKCHSDIDTFNLNGYQDETKERLEKLKKAVLEATGAAEIDSYHGGFLFKDENGEEIKDIPHEAYVAAYNWKLVKGDGSYGVHNPKYAKDLLEKSYEFLTNGTTQGEDTKNNGDDNQENNE
ncbi:MULTISPECIES: ammonia-forming cytochrome c nitrite reductase subunit c552 [unclassified Candidatus Frackibacter]|uniref:ammonia-forming cytochrome c nitrite reductase subunit c552 n=1 Tax=unclassified Candidatus Frackibacter TaxID=2648818 RepID=UPI00087E7422|nr:MULTISPECIES: ammonia-forming cytochrome c nitrite reductase subunit c552 [unclassified Candidatus Frackibacter]SDC16971.1 Cytochrome c552 [Candidatus Frackibacter sp. WG11]SEM44722.1 Cytochrome c552 [Candidatus Frackibacter sp. WG12]SFL47262.1 Cytochrome c552 [Candidatus Frackibacter sp. WG13]